MFKIVTQTAKQLSYAPHIYINLPISPILVGCVVAATHKNLSQSHGRNKKFVVKDHYEFDQKIINNDNPVVVNFHAEWCDPCKILTPKLLELLETSDEIDLAVIDVDNNPNLVEIFEVKAVPAVLAFRNGVVVDKFIGLTDIDSIVNLVDKLRQKKKTNVETNVKNSADVVDK